MATVYLAEDLKHRRKVALKVLKPELAAVVGADRFLAEIQTTANLQHPHILPLFDSGAADSFLFYVMPYVEDESLRERLDREKQLSVGEAVRIATAVASALDYAHRHRVIHRDIKPANILLQDGQPVVADFGIALAVGAAGGTRLTETGLSLGTPFYMSPEQATGDTVVGPAADGYALGCVLYEMLVGEPPYPGNTAQAVLAKIISGAKVAPRVQRASIPPNVDAVIRCALERVPADRFESAAALAKALGDPAFRHGEPANDRAAEARPLTRTLVAASVATLLLGGVAGWGVARNGMAAPLPTARVSVVLPADRPVGFGWSPGRSLAISPDGTELVYVARDSEKQRLSWPLALRSLASRAIRELPGTAGGFQPFFSPDGRWVAFFTGAGDLKKIALDGGESLTLAKGINGAQWCFGTWTDDGAIVFASYGPEGLRRVSADGGSPENLTTVATGEGEARHTFPEFVPGTRTVLFTVMGQGLTDVHIEAVNLDTGARRRVIENGSESHYFEGRLLFRRDGKLVAAPFDVDELTLAGPVVPMDDEVRTDGGDPGREGRALQLAVSRNGTLAYVPPPTGGRASLGVLRLDGTFAPFGPSLINPGVATPRVSPDGRYVAFADGPDEAIEVYLHDVRRGSTDRLTQLGTNYSLAWHPSGKALTFNTRGAAQNGLVLKDLAGTERIVVRIDPAIYSTSPSWSPNGELLAYVIQTGAQHDIWVVSPDDPSSAKPLIASSATEHSPTFSPDGDWLAYVSDESGELQVYVRGFPEGGRLRVSTESGLWPKWSPNGRELFFVDRSQVATRRLMSVSVTTEGETLRLGTPRRVLDLRTAGPERTFVQYGAGYANQGTSFDVLPDGRGFVLARTLETPSLEIVLVQNFGAELKAVIAK